MQSWGLIRLAERYIGKNDILLTSFLYYRIWKAFKYVLNPSPKISKLSSSGSQLIDKKPSNITFQGFFALLGSKKGLNWKPIAHLFSLDVQIY